ncbi:hypothetical protein QN386_08655 [Pseudomonas sp. CCI3.2]|uniref:hypothetical protein n=1 Tax=unclassified Pseudomonas TaxID=196821 RepID=UPI002AC920CD|nr:MULTISPECIES: hypothetical protein [unclassified Pseudomonas]MEB0075943.1 hypothetical protein [Pseudomonas sp. MH10out]MEB0101388.1 hypothetical protein [Pseudomonas sp. CCI3.2]MEB0130922.1 hypothetical protein [Pseudomonas sp. CCI2.4]MEB0157900.1 hypothetical protein [Pseudomonas sp. AH2 (2023)]MEB0166395.1 hypothetical protein [Pseudomonas sp. CCC4.4]
MKKHLKERGEFEADHPADPPQKGQHLRAFSGAAKHPAKPPRIDRQSRKHSE